MKNAIFGSLYKLINAQNVKGKLLFIKDYDGLAVLERLLSEDLTIKLQKVVFQLLNDLLKNDEQISGLELNGEKRHFRKYFAQKKDLIRKLFDYIVRHEQDKETLYVREYSFRVLV